MRSAWWLPLVLLVAGCAGLRVGRGLPPPDCPPGWPRDAAVFDSTRLADLTGTFRLVQVFTSWPADSGRLPATRHQLTLRPVTAAELVASRVSIIGHPGRRSLRRLGTSLRSDGAYREAELDGDTLYLGCHPGDCLDGQTSVLEVNASSAVGFWGTWTATTGLGRPFDPRTGKWLPDPAGYFCALRDSSAARE